MSTVKTIFSIVVIFVLASCGTGTPASTPTSLPTTPPQPSATATPLPVDIPIYRNSFEDVTDLAASGITSNANVKITTENVDYASGNKALEVSGTLPGAQWSNIFLDFSMKKLIGEDTLNLSDKTFGYSDLFRMILPSRGEYVSGQGRAIK
jgi:hypothetical protein